MPCTNSASDALHPQIPICFRAADGMMVVRWGHTDGIAHIPHRQMSKGKLQQLAVAGFIIAAWSAHLCPQKLPTLAIRTEFFTPFLGLEGMVLTTTALVIPQFPLSTTVFRSKSRYVSKPCAEMQSEGLPGVSVMRWFSKPQGLNQCWIGT